MRTLLTLSLAILACGGRDPEIRVADLELRLLRADDCQPRGEVTQVLVQALGDFPPSDESTIDVLRPSVMPGLIERFPADTQIIGVRAMSADWVGVGVRFITEDTMGPLLLIPTGRSCPLADFGDVPLGARAVALPDGGLLVVGGEDGEVGTRRISRLLPGERMSVGLSPDDALDEGRAGHVLVATDTHVLIIGGALGTTGGPANDRWESFDLATGRIVPEQGMLQRRRVEAAAALLPDGRVLVAGGRQVVGGEALDSVEVLDPSTGRSETRPAMRNAQASARMLSLDDGSVILVGGAGNAADFLPFVSVWDPDSESLLQLEGLTIGRWEEGFDVTVLEGGRALVVGDTIGSTRTTNARLIAHVPPSAISFEITTLNLDIPDLTQVRTTELDDGRVLITGRDSFGDPRAFAFDLGQVNLEGLVASTELNASRVPEILLTLADGVVAEIGNSSSSLRRVGELQTPLHNTPATLAADDLARNAPERWVTGALIANMPNARADIPTLRFGDVLIELEVDNAGSGVEVLLRPTMRDPIAVRIRDNTVGPALCEVERIEGEVIRIERRRDRVIIEAGAESRTCTLEGLSPRVGIGFRAAQFAGLRNISVRRL